MIVDYSSEQHMHSPDSFEEFRSDMLDKGMDSDTWEHSWKCLLKYDEPLREWLLQYVLIGMRSQWDWYISRLGEFVLFARTHTASPPLGKKSKRDLQGIGFKSMSDQLAVLEIEAGATFEIDDVQRSLLSEMALVRNIVLHNRGEVDDHYLRKSTTGPWKVGELRDVSSSELGSWHLALVHCIGKTSTAVAQTLVEVPPYPQEGGGA